MSDDTFLTVSDPAGPCELKERGSRFIGYVAPVSDRSAADDFIERLRKQYHDATHVCFAFRLGDGTEDDFRYADDGEPSGTAGKPIYSTIVSANLFNICVASIRYYGGTKLGTGGLTRAYRDSAKMVLDMVSVLAMTNTVDVVFSIGFDAIGTASVFIERKALMCVARTYSTDGVMMTLRIPRSQEARIRHMLVDVLSGNVVFPDVSQRDI